MENNTEKNKILEYTITEAVDVALFSTPVILVPPATKREKIRTGKHLTDNILSYDNPDKTETVFSDLDLETLAEIKNDKPELYINGNRRIDLSPVYNKIRLALENLLHKKSNTSATNNVPDNPDNYYMGNMPPHVVLTANGERICYPRIRVTGHEIVKEITGSSYYSGAEYNLYMGKFKEFSDEKYLTTLKKKRREAVLVRGKKKTYKTFIDRRDKYQSLYVWEKVSTGLTEQQDRELDKSENILGEKGGEYIITYNPLFRQDIDKIFIERDLDIIKRKNEVLANKRQVSRAVDLLIEEIQRAHSNHKKNKYIYSINTDRLPKKLQLDKYMKEGRKKLVQKEIEKAKEAVIKLGLVKDIKEIIGKNGQSVTVFYLNENY